MNKKGYEVYEKKGRRIVRGLGHYEAQPVYDCREIVKKSAAKYKDKTAFKFKRDGKIIEKTYIEFDQDVDALGTALHSWD